MCRISIQKHFQVPRHVRLAYRKACCNGQSALRKACNGVANAKAFLERLAGLPQTPKHFPRDLRNFRKCRKALFVACGTSANAEKHFLLLAGLPQTPKSFSRDLRNSRKRQGKKRACGGSCFPVHALCSASTLWMDGAGYLAIFSSHFNMPSMTNMEMRQMVRKTVQHCQMGILLYISGPIQRKRLPMAVAPSQRP